MTGRLGVKQTVWMNWTAWGKSLIQWADSSMQACSDRCHHEGFASRLSARPAIAMPNVAVTATAEP